MLKERKFFEYFWKTITYFGINHYDLNKYEKLRAILWFISNAVLNFILYIVALIVYDDMESRINGLQTFPFFIQMLLDGSNFAIKCQRIKKLYYRLDKAFERVNGEEHFISGYSKFMNYVTFCLILGSISVFGGLFIFLVTGKTAVLIYVPFKHGLGFFIIWLAQAIFFFYSTILNLFLDTFMNGILIILSSYVKALRCYVMTKNISNLREILELDLDLREMLIEYENAFSSVLLYRGFVSVVSLSSIVFELVNGATKNTITLAVFGTNLLFRFYLPSFFGNEIQYDCAEFLNDIYRFNWIEAKVKEKKNFILIQENVKKNYRIVAAKVFPINLNTFLRIIQSAYSFYAVLKQTKD